MQTTQVLPSLLKSTRHSSVLLACKDGETRSLVKGGAGQLPTSPSALAANTKRPHDAILGATVQRGPEINRPSDGLIQHPSTRAPGDAANKRCSIQVLLDAKVQKDSETDSQAEGASPAAANIKVFNHGEQEDGMALACRRRSTVVMGSASMPKRVRRATVRIPDSPNLARGKLMLQQFAFFRSLPEQIQSKMLSLVKYTAKSIGTVLFQQGDPAGDVYIILSGAIGILVAPQTSSAAAEQSETEVDEDEDGDGEEEQRSEIWEEDEAEWGTLGTQVAVLGQGSLVGEQSTIHAKPRNASGICTEDTELLFISKLDFQQTLMADMAGLTDDKQYWLDKHVPGIRRLNQNQLEFALLNFEIASFLKGHKFIQQGTVTAPNNEEFYLLRKGEIEIQHNLGVDAQGRTATLGVFVEGGVFGSLADGTPEPFTLVVSRAPCELLVASGANYRRLPMSLKHHLRGHVRQISKWRLQQTLQAPAPAPRNSTHVFPQALKCIATRRAFTHMSSHAKRQHMRRCSSLPTSASFRPAGSRSGMAKSNSHQLLPEIHQGNSRSMMLKPGFKMC